MAKFKPGDWVQIEDRALGLKSVGKIEQTCVDSNGSGYYSIQWLVNTCSKTQGIQPTSLYPMVDFDNKGCLAATAQVLYGTKV